MTALAFVVPLTGICRHRYRLRVAAGRTSQDRFEDHDALLWPLPVQPPRRKSGQIRMPGMRPCEVVAGVRRAVRFPQDECCVDVGRNAAQVRQEIIDERDRLQFA